MQVKAGMLRLLKYNAPEWPYAICGMIGSGGVGLVMPAFALALSNVLGV